MTAQATDGHDDRGEPGQDPARRGRDVGSRDAALGFLVGHHVHVDRAGMLHRGRADALVEDPGPSRSPRGPEHELGGVDVAREFEQAGRHVVADDGVQARAEAGGQLAHLAHLRGRHPGQAVAAHHVHDHQLGARLRRDPARPAHQGLGFGTPGDGDHHPFAGLPGVGDVFVGTVFRERGIDLIGEPQQREFPQRGEVAGTEVVAQCRVDLLRRVHVAVGEPAAQRLRGDVDELDLVGARARPRRARSRVASPR